MPLIMVGASPGVLHDINMHCHDCYEIIMNSEGEGVAEIGGKEYPFVPGVIHVIPPDMPHTKKSADGFRDIYLHADSLQPAGLPVKKAFEPREPLVLTDDASGTLEKLMSVLLSRYLLGAESDEITGMLFEIVLHLVEKRSTAGLADPVISELIRTITNSYSDPDFQVTDALLNTGFSKDYIRRRFRSVTGMTPVEYLRNVRISYARRMLRQKDTLHLSINEIALMSGFYDVSYFCRVFHRVTGVSPTQYMNQN